MATTIGVLSLTNAGAFAVELQCQYLEKSTSRWVKLDGTDKFTNGTTETIDLGAIGCPNDSTVQIYAVVVGGQDKTGTEQFTFKSGDAGVAPYAISGSTMINTLRYLGTAIKS